MGDILNKKTPAELAAIRERALAGKRRLSACLWCGKALAMRPDQKFCSAKCRLDCHIQVAKNEELERQNREREWLIERDGLLREIAALRHQVAELGGTPRDVIK